MTQPGSTCSEQWRCIVSFNARQLRSATLGFPGRLATGWRVSRGTHTKLRRRVCLPFRARREHSSHLFAKHPKCCWGDFGFQRIEQSVQESFAKWTIKSLRNSEFGVEFGTCSHQVKILPLWLEADLIAQHSIEVSQGCDMSVSPLAAHIGKKPQSERSCQWCSGAQRKAALRGYESSDYSTCLIAAFTMLLTTSESVEVSMGHLMSEATSVAGHQRMNLLAVKMRRYKYEIKSLKSSSARHGARQQYVNRESI
jgi:hypothetical protein